jgi:hypothetical protein
MSPLIGPEATFSKGGDDSVLVCSWLFIFVSGVVTYLWFSHLGLFLVWF